jgi:hypothetical protein
MKNIIYSGEGFKLELGGGANLRVCHGHGASDSGVKN